MNETHTPVDASTQQVMTRRPLWKQWQHRFAAVLVLLFSSAQAIANLPTTAPPSRGSTDGDYIGLIQDYAYDIFLFLGLAMATLAFFTVTKNTIGAYGEVQDGKGTWGQLGINFGAGVLLLVFVVFLLTEAAAIL